MKKFKQLILLEQQFFNMNHVFAKFVMKLLEKRIKIKIGLKDFICFGFSYNDLFSIVEFPIHKWNIYAANGKKVNSITIKSQIEAYQQLYKLLNALNWSKTNNFSHVKRIYNNIENEV